jgi:hypothetical protein
MIACHKRRDAAPRVHAAQAAEPKPIYRNNGMSGTSLISYWADGALSIGYCQYYPDFLVSIWTLTNAEAVARAPSGHSATIASREQMLAVSVSQPRASR